MMVSEKKFAYRLPNILEALDEEELSQNIPKLEMSEVYFDEVQERDTASMKVVVTSKIIKLFAMVSGDYNPLHVDADFARKIPPKLFGGKNIAHGILLNSFLSALVTLFMGRGVTLLEWRDQKFKKAVKVGDTIVAKLQVARKYTQVVREKERFYIDLTGLVVIQSKEREVEATRCSILVTLFKKSRT